MHTSILMTMTTTTVAMMMHAVMPTDSSFSFSKENKAMSWLGNTSVTNQPQHSSFEENYTEQTMTISDVFIHIFLKMSSLNEYCTQQTMTISAGLFINTYLKIWFSFLLVRSCWRLTTLWSLSNNSDQTHPLWLTLNFEFNVFKLRRSRKSLFCWII